MTAALGETLSDNAILDTGRRLAAAMKGHRIKVTDDFLIRFGRFIEGRIRRVPTDSDLLAIIDELSERLARVEGGCPVCGSPMIGPTYLEAVNDTDHHSCDDCQAEWRESKRAAAIRAGK